MIGEGDSLYIVVDKDGNISKRRTGGTARVYESLGRARSARQHAGRGARVLEVLVKEVRDAPEAK